MESKAKLIYKSYMTYFHTFLPVYFYGMPNGKIYCMYARFYQGEANKSEFEFVFAEHEDFTYDYDSDLVFVYGTKGIDLDGFKDLVDQPNQRIKLIEIYGRMKSYAEAQQFLELKADEMMNALNPVRLSITG